MKQPVTKKIKKETKKYIYKKMKIKKETMQPNVL